MRMEERRGEESGGRGGELVEKYFQGTINRAIHQLDVKNAGKKK